MINVPFIRTPSYLTIKGKEYTFLINHHGGKDNEYTIRDYRNYRGYITRRKKEGWIVLEQTNNTNIPKHMASWIAYGRKEK